MGNPAKTIGQIIETESFEDKLVNIQKVVHVDTAGRGNHNPTARVILDGLGLVDSPDRVKLISDVILDFEKERCKAILVSQQRRIPLIRDDYLSLKEKLKAV